jgi:hypothetical protein
MDLVVSEAVMTDLAEKGAQSMGKEHLASFGLLIRTYLCKGEKMNSRGFSTKTLFGGGKTFLFSQIRFSSLLASSMGNFISERKVRGLAN